MKKKFKYPASAVRQAKRFINKLESELGKTNKLAKTLKTELGKAKKNLRKIT